MTAVVSMENDQTQTILRWQEFIPSNPQKTPRPLGGEARAVDYCTEWIEISSTGAPSLFHRLFSAFLF